MAGSMTLFPLNCVTTSFVSTSLISSSRTGNYENDLQVAENASFDTGEAELLPTGFISTDINGELLNTSLKLVSNRPQLRSGRTTQSDNTQCISLHLCRGVPVTSYTLRGQITPVDDWADPCYFTAAFPTLFPTGIGGNLDERPFPLSLGLLVEWAMIYHNRR